MHMKTPTCLLTPVAATPSMHILIPTVYPALLKNAVPGIGQQIHTIKESLCVKDIPEGVAEPEWGCSS